MYKAKEAFEKWYISEKRLSFSAKEVSEVTWFAAWEESRRQTVDEVLKILEKSRMQDNGKLTDAYWFNIEKIDEIKALAGKEKE